MHIVFVELRLVVILGIQVKCALFRALIKDLREDVVAIHLGRFKLLFDFSLELF